MKTLEELIDEMPPELVEEVRDFAQSLMETKARPKQARLRLSWAGGLREYRDQFTSQELQKKSLDWWGA
ncbi:MAG: DUF2281 domain-containing protein [Candidatus Poribacteria bacterium]|nr:DUF2281 domain-containing protein [Candidatus Poribacteria bacterium]